MMIFRKGTAREEGVWVFFAARRKKNMENFLDLKDEHTQKNKYSDFSTRNMLQI
jgi:hypothetical protein